MVSRFFNPRQNGARGARGRLGRGILDSSDRVSLCRAMSDRLDVVHSSDTHREIERSKWLITKPGGYLSVGSEALGQA